MTRATEGDVTDQVGDPVGADGGEGPDEEPGEQTHHQDDEELRDSRAVSSIAPAKNGVERRTATTGRSTSAASRPDCD